MSTENELKNFKSTGIDDQASIRTLVVKNGVIQVDRISTNELEGDILVPGKLRVLGDLTVNKLIANEVLSNQKYEKQYLEFQPTDVSEEAIGSGLIWKGKEQTKMFVLRQNPNRFFSSENIDLNDNRAFSIDNVEVLSKKELGTTVRKSNLREVGILNSLTVSGDAFLGECLKVQSDQQRVTINTEQAVGILTMTDWENNVVLSFDVENGRGKFGTYNARSLDLVAGDQALLSLDPKGVLSLGNEYRERVTVRTWGKLGINVKNPEVDLEINGSFKFGNKHFIVDNKVPEKGNYNRGDICWNELPTAGSPIGWVCTVTGNPGVWLPFGMIQN